MLAVLEHKPLADVGLAASIVLPTGAWLAQANEWVTFIGGSIGIIAGIASAWYYISRIIALRKLNKHGTRSKSPDSVDS